MAAAGLLASLFTQNPIYDGLASIAISVILALTAFQLASESKSLLIGVPADPLVARALIVDVKTHRSVDVVNGMVSVHLAPDQILVAMSVAFRQGLTTFQMETAIAEIESQLLTSYPQIIALFLKPQSPSQYAEMHGKGAPIAYFSGGAKIAATPYTSI